MQWSIAKIGMLQYALVLVLVSVSIFILGRSGLNFEEVLSQIGIVGIAGSLFFCILVFTISGWKTATLVKVTSGVSIRLHDYALLPIMMNLWGYLIPVRGGVVFAVFYLKSVYSVAVIHAFNVFFISFYSTFVVCGLVFVVLSVLDKSFFIYTVFYLVFLAVVFLALKLLSSKRPKFKVRFKWAEKTLNVLVDLGVGIYEVMTVKRVFMVLFVQNFIHISITACWFYFIVKLTSMNVGFLVVYLGVSAIQLASFIRLLPGNLGINEMVIAGVFLAFGESAADGVMLALVIRVVTLLVTFTVGVGANFMLIGGLMGSLKKLRTN